MSNVNLVQSICTIEMEIPIETKKMEESLKISYCLICLENKSNCILQPCGHSGKIIN